MQDSKNVDPNCILLNNDSFVGCNGDFDTYAFSENRSVCSCNGLVGDVDRRDCFPSAGSTHGYYSARAWAADSVYFRDTPGPYYKNDWHFIETWFELNSIDNGKGIPDGKIRYWYDGQLLITSDSILFRTAAHPDMQFIQLFFGGYIGVGSPVDQTWWVDDLTLADGILTVGRPQLTIGHQELNVYPNPNDGEFTVEITGDMTSYGNSEIFIFNLPGKQVYHDSFSAARKTFDIHLPPGIYYTQLNSPAGISCLKKFIVL
jgi:hypothetical protein